MSATEDLLTALPSDPAAERRLRDRLVAEASEHVLTFDWADVARQAAGLYAEVSSAERGVRSI